MLFLFVRRGYHVNAAYALGIMNYNIFVIPKLCSDQLVRIDALLTRSSLYAVPISDID